MLTIILEAFRELKHFKYQFIIILKIIKYIIKRYVKNCW